MDDITPRPIKMSDVLGPWPIKHRAHIALLPSYLGARKGYAIAVPNLIGTTDEPILAVDVHRYWCDQTQPEDRCDVETQYTATVMFSTDRNEAAIFATPEEAATAFDRRAAPFLTNNSDWLKFGLSEKVRLMMFRLREPKTAQ